MTDSARTAASRERGPGGFTRVYQGPYDRCREALASDAAELGRKGYAVRAESYNVTWASGVCIGCLIVEFGRIGSPATRAQLH